MIELIYNEETECETEEGKLQEPKNRKQIGLPQDHKKIFVEDYVDTFLRQYAAEGKAHQKTAVLLGRSESGGGKRHLYIESALAIGELERNGEKYLFTEKLWTDIYRECEKYFPGQEIIGWFLSCPGFPIEDHAENEETHRTYFSGADKVLFMMEPVEGESAFYAFEGSRFMRQSGYYIYYEKNEPMQEYMICQRKNEKKESLREKEQPDAAMANFRRLLKEKQDKKEQKRKRVVSYGAKTAVFVLLFVGAAALWKENISVGKTEKAEEAAMIPELTDPEKVTIEEVPGEVRKEETKTEPAALPETEEEVQKGESLEEIPVEAAAAEPEMAKTYTIQPGDTLLGISRSYYGTEEMVDEICAYNGIEDGDYIQIGETILLP